MADKKISQLTGATTPLAGTEVLPIVQGGSTVKVSVDNLTVGKTVKATTFDTDVAAAKVTLTGTTLAASGTDADINVNVTPKGTGSVVMPKAQVSGTLTVTSAGQYIKNHAANVDSTAFLSNSTGTGANFIQLVSTGGTYNFGIENSASTYWGTPAYSCTVAIPSTRSFTVFAGGVGQLLTASASTTNVTVNQGNLVVGTAAKGIDFSANTHAAGMTSELLNWYEEGTWTPTVSGASGTTYTTQNGWYTRIGNLVTVGFELTINAAGTITGGASIAGLPFTSAATYKSSGSLSFAGTVVTSTVWQGLVIGASQSVLTVYVKTAASASTTSINGSDFFGAGTQLIGLLTYRV
jgi:hypothetical protein